MRFTLTRRDAVVDVVFDDGGMNLLSTAALGELGERLRDAGFELRGQGAESGDAVPPGHATRNPRLLVFRSARPALFAAGADMSEMARFSAADAEAFARLGQELFAAIERLPCLTVCAIDGDCFGGALDLAMAFDLRFATERSRFSHPGARLGIVTGFGGTSRWRKLLERPAARRLFLGNGVLPAHEALSSGLVDAIGEPDLAHLAALDPAMLRMVKELAPRAERLDRRSLLLLAERLFSLESAPTERAVSKP
jgi:enoyl-CoA hydratase/carnithine racemase